MQLDPNFKGRGQTIYCGFSVIGGRTSEVLKSYNKI